MNGLGWIYGLAALLLVMLLYRFLRKGSAAKEEQTFVDGQQNWILVGKGSPAAVENAVRAYGEILANPPTRQHRVVLSRHTSGFLVLTFPDGMPPYAFTNFIGWLDQPPDMPEVSKACGFFTSKATGVRYFLAPDHTNPNGDTLIGRSSDGHSVAVYQPETDLWITSSKARARPEPELGNLEALRRFELEIPLEILEGFGNPDFCLTRSETAAD